MCVVFYKKCEAENVLSCADLGWSFAPWVSGFTNCVIFIIKTCNNDNLPSEVVIKGIVHFEIKIWYLSAYTKGIQDVGVFFSSVDPILMFLGQTVLVWQSYNGRYRSLSL